jgi:hypothetical protein
MIASDWDPAELPPPSGLPITELFETISTAEAMPPRDWPEPAPEDKAAAAAAWAAGIEESARRLGMTRAEYLNLVDPVPDRRAAPIAYRTLADVSDDPPGPLLFGMLEPAADARLRGTGHRQGHHGRMADPGGAARRDATRCL